MAGSTPRSSLVTAAAATALLLLLLPAATAVCDAGDKAALLELKNSLRNPVAFNSWRIATDCCDDWAATQCDSNGRVINVEISSASDAVGSLPPEIGDLSFIQALTLSKLPNLTGPIPAEICKLRQLSYLQLQTNGLTGAIPECIGQLRNLNYLSLAQNKLTGSIPSSLGRALNIIDLYLDSNQLTGPVPASLANLQPQRVNISRNKLSGDAAALISAWKTAEVIDFSHNAFQFNLRSVRFPTGLRAFNIRQNSIYGTIPPNADGMTGLRQFDVSHNKLCGSIPQGGVINRFPVSSFDGNTCLCGTPLIWCIILNCPLLCGSYSATAAASL